MNSTEPKFSRMDFALLVLLAGLIVLFFWRILTPNPVDRAQFPPGDFTDQFYAFRLYEARAFIDGHIPLWSENFNSGHPFLADIQSAVFYPPAFLNTVLNLALWHSFSLFALEWEALLHFYLAGAFTYLFARRVFFRSSSENVRAPSVARVAAFTSAIVFTFGGYLTSYPSLQLAILETAAWLPLALYLLTPSVSPAPSGRRGMRQDADAVPQSVALTHQGGAGSPLILAGIVLGVAAMAGHPQTFLFVLAVCVIYFVFTRWNGWNRRVALRWLAAIVLVCLIAFGVAAVQLVPAIEYQRLSTREALSFADAAKGLPTLDILQFILPGYTSAFASPLYVGILPLWLAILALLQRGRARVFWGVMALGSLILSFGFYVFAYVVFYLLVPGAGLFRDQERAAFIVSFALAMLAGFGMGDVLSGLAARRVRQLFPLLLAGSVVTFVLLLAFFVAGAENPQGRLSFLGDRAGLMLVVFGLASLWVGIYSRGLVNARIFTILALVLILFDLWSVNEPANKGQVQERYPENPLISAVQQDTGLFRVSADENLFPGHFGIVYNLQEVGGISPLRLANYNEFLSLPETRRLPMLNVKYIFTKQKNVTSAVPVADDDDAAVFRMSDTLPRAWLVGASAVQADDTQALQQMSDANFNPSQTAILTTPPPFAPDASAAQGSVTIQPRTDEAFSMDVNAPADGLIVISENYYPGWRATIDGAPTEILRADVTLRALPIHAGQHHIEMWYDPLSFKLGAVISVITVLACAVSLIYFLLKK